METSPKLKPEDDPQRVLRAVGDVLSALKGLSNKEALQVLKMVGSTFNVHPASNFAAQSLSGRVASGPQAKPVKGPGGGQRPLPENRDPTVVKIRLDLRKLQDKVLEVSGSFPGGVLPNDHALILERDQLLAALKAAKGSFRAQSARKSSSNDGVTPSKEEAK